MSTKTPNLGLIKPARGEFTDTWDIPLNANSDSIDTAVGDLQTEVTDARGNADNLNDRISAAIDVDGNPLASAEIVASRNSQTYGAQSTLGERLLDSDNEILAARGGLAGLIDGIASGLSSHVDNSVNTAPGGFLSFTGANLKVDGSSTAVVSDINGYRQVTSSLLTKTISGPANTFYAYLQRSATGTTVLDRTGGGQNTGSVTVDLSTNLTVLNDTTQNFASLGIKVGQQITITSIGSLNDGTYVIAAVGYNSDPNNLQIVGQFVTAQASLNYKIVDPIAPTLNTTTTAPALRYVSVSNKIYVGEAVFDGANITGVTPYALKGHYEGFTSVTLSGGDFSLTIAHNLGYVPTSVRVFGSQASDFSQALEPLASGVYVAIKADRSNIYIKDVTNGTFYKDFSGTNKTSGFVFVVADR
jgi:hypothetical protein